MVLQITYEERFGVQNIDLYYDTPEQWERVYGKKSDLKSCAEKESVLQVDNSLEQTNFNASKKFLSDQRTRNIVLENCLNCLTKTRKLQLQFTLYCPKVQAIVFYL